DLEHDFRDGGRLPVFGTDSAVLRIGVRMLNGLITGYYTDWVWSQDGHPPLHISYGSRWQVMKGGPLDMRGHKAAYLKIVDDKFGLFEAFAPATGESLGIIQSTVNQKKTVEYWNHLQATKQGPMWV